MCKYDLPFRIMVSYFMSSISVFNKNTWREAFEFFVEKMDGFERFYYEYEDFIKDV